MSIPIQNSQRREAMRLIAAAQKALEALAETCNLDHEAREAANRARDEVSIAEMIILNQPSQP